MGRFLNKNMLVFGGDKCLNELMRERKLTKYRKYIKGVLEYEPDPEEFKKPSKTKN